MTAFTDDDVKRLKESENALQRSLGIPALLARLEAAEKVCHYVRLWLIHQNPNTDIELPLTEWLRAAGKGR